MCRFCDPLLSVGSSNCSVMLDLCAACRRIIIRWRQSIDWKWEAVRRLLAEDRLRPTFLFEMVPTRMVEAAELAEVDPNLESLRNLNTPEEYEAALALSDASEKRP